MIRISGAIHSLRTDALAWSAGRSPWPRLPLLLLMGYIALRCLNDPGYWSLFSGLNLGIHELGHYAFAPLGRLMGVLGGSLLQCMAPLVAIIMFHRQRDYFAITVGLGWFATNLFGVATYVADARSMQLPLVTPGGGEALHDWNIILGQLGGLRHDQTYAGMLRVLGLTSFGLSLLGGAWVLLNMRGVSGEPSRPPDSSSLQNAAIRSPKDQEL